MASRQTLTKLALLIDGENISATYMPLIMREAEERGAVAIRRVYGHFKGTRMKAWTKQIEAFDLTPVNVSPITLGKNAADLKLVIEAMDMLTGRQLDGICIASSDGDFTALAERIRASALTVFGFGAKKAPKAYKDMFDRFYECDTLLAAEKKPAASTTSSPAAATASPEAAPEEKKPAPRRRSRARKPAGETAKAAPETPSKPAPARSASPARPEAGKKAIPEAEVMDAIDAAMGDDGLAPVRAVGNGLSRAIPGFAAKTYGFKSTTDLVGALPRVELTKKGNETFVRWKTG